MKKVFINYSWDHDQSAADYVYDKLTAANTFDVWRDKEKLLGGVEWRRTLRDTIRETDYFVCIMSSGSIEGRGIRNVEIRVALEVLEEFPPGEVYLVPTRVDNCTPKFSELKELNYVDLFPEKEEGIKKLLKALGGTSGAAPASAPRTPEPAPDDTFAYEADMAMEAEDSFAMPAPAAPILKNSITRQPPKPAGAAAPAKKHATPMHSYTVGVVDIDMGMSDMTEFVSKLNEAQTYFLFKAPQMPDIGKCTKTFGGIRNFAVFKVPESYISEQPLLASDLIACITKLPLAFDEGDHYAYNYFAGPSEQDNRFLFLSADRLDDFTHEAGCSFKEGLISILVGQLIAYFTGMGYHDETKSCVLDFCENRTDIVYSLKSRKLCPTCSAQLPKGDLRTALLKLLALKVQ